MRFTLTSTWGTLCLYLCLACLPTTAHNVVAQVNRGTHHPTRENIPEATDPSLVIDISDDDGWPVGPHVPDTSGMKTAVFGREDGEIYELLSWVRDIASDGHGSIFVLDADPRSNASSSLKIVHIIDSQARYLGSFGSAGEGPGEFLHPDHILVDEKGERVLIAGREREIDLFERVDKGTYRDVKSWDTKGGVDDACIMRDHVYLLYYDAESGHIIHKYTVDGEYVAGFGEPYKSTNPMVVQIFSGSGSLSCIAQPGVVGYIGEFIPVLMAYSEDGALLWRLKVEGIKSPVEVLETVSDGRPSIRYNSSKQNEKGRGHITASGAYGDGNFYVNVTKSLGDEERREYVFRVDALSGAYTHIGHGSVQHVTEHDLIVRLLWERDAAPQVEIRSRE